jgi:hypothetical protein
LETVHGTTTAEVNMPELEKTMFAGTEQPQAADWASLFTTNLERQHVEELLEAHGWMGETNAIVGVKLTPDNTKVNTARSGPLAPCCQREWSRTILSQRAQSTGSGRSWPEPQET